MSIKIHHGPPGSYKTAGAVHEDFVRAVLAGRHIITNVRGLSDREQVLTVLNGRKSSLLSKPMHVPESFQLTYLDASDSEQMAQLRRFFHWAPDGVFFLLDEIQEIYPPDMTPAKLKDFDFPGGLDAATAASTFETLALAFEKHRHKNWDFVVTTPNIIKVHKVVRGSAEAAYRHKNLAVMGSIFKGRYNEAFHAADNNGKAKTDLNSIIRKKIPKWVFQLYKSTQTGQVSDTSAGSNVFKDPKIIGFALVLVLALSYSLSNGVPSFMKSPEQLNAEREQKNAEKNGLAVPPVAQSSPGQAALVPVQTPIPAGSVPTSPVGTGLGSKVVATPKWLDFFNSEYSLAYTYYQGKQFFYGVNFSTKGGVFKLDKDQLSVLGLNYQVIDRCLVRLYYKDILDVYASCPKQEIIRDNAQALPVSEKFKEGALQNPFGN
ncbi:MAG: zonular occludens toxin family protein [Thiolinea sp.]